MLVAAIAANRPTSIIGERTYGKALIQHPYRLMDGSVLKLTVAEYLTPTDQHIGSGQVPPVAVLESSLEMVGLVECISDAVNPSPPSTPLDACIYNLGTACLDSTV